MGRKKRFLRHKGNLNESQVLGKEESAVPGENRQH